MLDPATRIRAASALYMLVTPWGRAWWVWRMVLSSALLTRSAMAKAVRSHCTHQGPGSGCPLYFLGVYINTKSMSKLLAAVIQSSPVSQHRAMMTKLLDALMFPAWAKS